MTQGCVTWSTSYLHALTADVSWCRMPPLPLPPPQTPPRPWTDRHRQSARGGLREQCAPLVTSRPCPPSSDRRQQISDQSS